jgi:hypothetical protein
MIPASVCFKPTVVRDDLGRCQAEISECHEKICFCQAETKEGHGKICFCQAETKGCLKQIKLCSSCISYDEASNRLARLYEWGWSVFTVGVTGASSVFG